MLKKTHILVLIVLVTLNLDLLSQKTLQIYYTRFDKLKKFELYVGDILEYKLKGQYSYRRNKITNLQDSIIIFSNDSIIKLDQIKAICIRKKNVGIRLCQSLFITGGGLFLFLNTTNNLINDRNPVVEANAVLIAAGLITGGFLIKQTGVKRLRMNGRKYLKVLDLNFNNLSEKK